MPSSRAGVLFVALLTNPCAAQAEPTNDYTPSAEKRSLTSDQEVRADDLALGKPTSRSSPNGPAAPSDPHQAAEVVAPELAQSATIAPQPSVTAAPSSVEAEAPSGKVDERPKRLQYNGETEVPGYELQEQRRWWMIGLGGGLFGVGYLAGIAVGADRGFDNGLGFAAIPLAGPWVAMAVHEDECVDGFSCSNSDSSLAAAGIIQGVGGILLTIGLATTRQVWIRKDSAWVVTPLLGQQRSGLQLSGVF